MPRLTPVAASCSLHLSGRLLQWVVVKFRMVRISWLTGAKVLRFGRKGQPSGRSFPTDGYAPTLEAAEATVAARPVHQGDWSVSAAGGSHDLAATADYRVMRGPTQADRDHLPYVQEAWEWAFKVARVVGLRRRSRSFPCVLDILTRMRVVALIEHRNLAWPETAVMVAGLDPTCISAEHHISFEEVDLYVSRAEGLVNRGLDDGWDGVVWGDIDPADPLRILEVDYEVCENCGRCVVVCPQVFTRSTDGEVRLACPTAVREKRLEESCLEALSQCPEGAISLNSRGGRTATGALPPRGRPLPGEIRD